MSFNDHSSSSLLSHYLQKLDKEPLLTKSEEEELVKNIEVLQDKILMDCANYYLFKDEFLGLVLDEQIAGEGIVNVSRKIDANSTEKAKKEIRDKWLSLGMHLAEPKSEEKTAEAIKAVGLSGNLVNNLVLKIKKKYAKIQECDAKLQKLLKYFECDNEVSLIETIQSVKKDDKFRKDLARKFFTTESALLNKLYEYEQFKSDLLSLEQLGLQLDDLGEAKELLKAISHREFQMKRYKDTLVERNLRLVVARAKKHMGKGMEFEDLIQEGNIGLIKAINKYDLSRGTKVATYATWWVDQSIRRAISNKSRTVRIPTHIEFMQSTLAGVIAELTKDLGRVPKLAEIAEKSGVPLEKLEGLQQRALHKVGIDEDLGSGMKLLDILPADANSNPAAVTAKKMLREKVRQIIGTLSPRTEKIIRLRFGIGEPHEELTLQDIAKQVGLTRMGVSVVQSKGLAEMKEKLDEYDEEE